MYSQFAGTEERMNSILVNSSIIVLLSSLAHICLWKKSFLKSMIYVVLHLELEFDEIDCGGRSWSTSVNAGCGYSSLPPTHHHQHHQHPIYCDHHHPLTVCAFVLQIIRSSLRRSERCRSCSSILLGEFARSESRAVRRGSGDGNEDHDHKVLYSSSKQRV